MSDSGGRTSVDIDPEPGHVVSRPLKTGQQYALILARCRIIYRGWDKEKYAFGDSATLLIEGEDLPPDLELKIDTCTTPGAWEQIDTVKAEPSGDKTEAKATWTIPKPKEQGKILKAEWARQSAKPGEQIGMKVELANYTDGAFLGFWVEKLEEDGQWRSVARWQSEVKSEKGDGMFSIPPPEEKKEPPLPGKVVSVEFEDTALKVGETAWLKATCEGMDGQQLQFVLEQRVDGKWTEVGSGDGTVGTLGSNNTHVAVHIPKGPPKLLKTGWKFDKALAAELLVSTQEMSYQDVTFILERKKGDGWETVKTYPEVPVDDDIAQIGVHFPALVKAAFSSKSPKPGDDVELIAFAGGMDGEEAEIIVEKQTDKGWVAAGSFNATFSGTSARTTVQLPMGPPEFHASSSKISGSGVTLAAETTGLEGQEVTFTLEVNQDGKWTSLGDQKATVTKAQAKVDFDLGYPVDAGGGTGPASS